MRGVESGLKNTRSRKQDKDRMCSERALNFIGKTGPEKLPGLWLSALSHTHTQFSDFPGESVYTKSFAITD